MLRRPEKTPNCNRLFHAPSRGRLFLLVSDHVLFSKVVVPEAADSQMIVAVAALHLTVKGMELDVCGFLIHQPLVLEAAITNPFGSQSQPPARGVAWRLLEHAQGAPRGSRIRGVPR